MTGIGDVLTFKHKMGIGMKCEGWVSCKYVKRRKSIPGGEGSNHGLNLGVRKEFNMFLEQLLSRQLGETVW